MRYAQSSMLPETAALAAAFGVRIRALRHLEGISQRELAEDVGLASPHLCLIEAGKVNVTLETIVKLSLRFGVSAGDLVAAVAEARGRRRR